MTDTDTGSPDTGGRLVAVGSATINAPLPMLIWTRWSSPIRTCSTAPNTEADLAGEPDHRLDDDAVTLSADDVGDETAVDLQHVERKRRQIGKTGVTSAKIVDSDGETFAAQARKPLGDRRLSEREVEPAAKDEEPHERENHADEGRQRHPREHAYFESRPCPSVAHDSRGTASGVILCVWQTAEGRVHRAFSGVQDVCSFGDP